MEYFEICILTLISKLQSISSLTAGGLHASQGKQEEVKTPLTNQAINHLAVTAKITHSGQKFAELHSLCRLLRCRFLVYNSQLNIDAHVVYETLWETFCLFLALAISDWLLPRSQIHLRACRLPAVRVEIHYNISDARTITSLVRLAITRYFSDCFFFVTQINVL